MIKWITNQGKKVIIISTTIFLLLVTAVSWWFIRGKTKTNDYNKNLTMQVDRKLSPEDRKIFENRLGQAEQQLKNLAKNASKKSKYTAYFNLGNQYYGLGQLAKAREAYLEAEKYQTVSPNVYLSLYNVYAEMQDFDNAKLTMERAIKNDPLDPEMWRQYIYLQRDKFNASEAGMDSLYNYALKSTQNNSVVLAMYSEFLDGIGDSSRAISYLQKAIKENPDGKSLYEQEIARIRAK